MAALSNDPSWRFSQQRTITADIFIRHEGTIVLLLPMNDEADEWLDEHLAPEITRTQFGYPVHPYEVNDVIEKAREAGHKVGSR